MPHSNERAFYAERDALIQALQQVPDGVVLVKNQVGNLTGVTRDNGVMVGYLDIHAQQWVLTDRDSEDQR